MNILVYCPKCGTIAVRQTDSNNETGIKCIICDTVLKIIPHKYLDNDGRCLDKDEERLIEELIKTSAQFDKDLFEHRVALEYEALEKRDRHIQNERYRYNQTCIPKCPTCGSTHVQPISMAKKAAGGLMFGLFSSNVRKSYECLNCKYKW